MAPHDTGPTPSLTLRLPLFHPVRRAHPVFHEQNGHAGRQNRVHASILPQALTVQREPLRLAMPVRLARPTRSLHTAQRPSSLRERNVPRNFRNRDICIYGRVAVRLAHSRRTGLTRSPFGLNLIGLAKPSRVKTFSPHSAE